MASDDKDLGHLSLEVMPGDLIALGKEVRLMITERKRSGAIRLKVIAPKATLIYYKPRRLLRGT